MMGVSNLREYASQNPPWVTFFLCLLSLAISAIFLSSYSYTHTLPNPDTEKDWNHLLSSLSQFQLCVNAGATSSEPGSPVPTPPMDTSSITPTSKTPITNLHVKVPLTLTPSWNSVSMKDLALHTVMRGKQLNLGGEEIISVTLELFSGKENYTCLMISAPTDLLPMNPLPPQCPASEKNIAPINAEASKQPPAASQTCYSLHSEKDPSLIVMLTREEQSLAERHLLEASVFLFGLCMVLSVAASLTHSLVRRHHWTAQDQDNKPLIDS